MKRYRGHQEVEPGLYFNLARLSFKFVEEKGPLPGVEGDVYRRVPVAALLLVGPILGLAFVVFLPFIGFALLGWLVVGKIVQWTTDAVVAFGRVIRPAWRPAAAFLSRAKQAKPEDKKRDPWIDDVSADLDEKPAQEQDDDATLN